MEKRNVACPLVLPHERFKQWLERRTTTIANTQAVAKEVPGDLADVIESSSLIRRSTAAAIEREEEERTSVFLYLEVVRKFVCKNFRGAQRYDRTFCHVVVRALRGKERRKERRSPSSTFVLAQEDLLSHSQSEVACGAARVGRRWVDATVKETLPPGPLPSRVCFLSWPSCAAPPGNRLTKNSPDAGHGSGVDCQSFRGRKLYDVNWDFFGSRVLER